MPASSFPIDLHFRPETYFGPMDPRTRVISSIKGAERRAYVKQMFAEGREDEIPSDLLQPALSPEARRAAGARHPWFMGGEYLPDRQEGEVEIARITIASTTQDVTCIYALQAEDRIRYRVVDEYEGDTLGDASEHSSKLTLTLGELEDYFLGAWDLFGLLDMNFEADDYPPERVRCFVEASSEFYSDFGKLIGERVDGWLRVQHAEDGNDDE